MPLAFRFSVKGKGDSPPSQIILHLSNPLNLFEIESELSASQGSNVSESETYRTIPAVRIKARSVQTPFIDDSDDEEEVKMNASFIIPNTIHDVLFSVDKEDDRFDPDLVYELDSNSDGECGYEINSQMPPPADEVVLFLFLFTLQNNKVPPNEKNLRDYDLLNYNTHTWLVIKESQNKLDVFSKCQNCDY
ncbi:hypothetical protein BC830DRAFT_1215892 [Chytriomyces sp. MP71]|nr:hypothetical protein BC830DRAFT_1215892 [Chytriomyces sp. MP71]